MRITVVGAILVVAVALVAALVIHALVEARKQKPQQDELL